MSIKGFIFNIKKYCINDGPGIRTTVFLKGCPLNCWWCHNPESRKLKPEPVKGNSYSWSIYSQSCSPDVIGKEVSIEEILLEIFKDIPFYEESGGGVTFSGGEPLLQPEFLMNLLVGCKNENIHTAVDTSGFSDFSILEKISGITDLFLYDLKIIDDDTHKKFTGVSNKLIHENLVRLLDAGNKIIIRIPVIPAINNAPEKINDFINFLSPLNIQEINLLPFHNSAVSKYSRMNIENRLPDLVPLQTEEMEKLRIKFLETGKKVSVGG